MVRARDSFLHFISDNIPQGVTLHPVRRDPNDRSSDALQMNAVNVSFLNLTAGNDTALCAQQVVIDVTFDDENTAVDCVGSLFDVLRTAFYAPLLNYSDPSSPVPTGTNIMWDRRRVTFKRLPCDSYCHYSCLLSLRFASA